MGAGEPFPRPLRWALLGPLAIWFVCYVLALADAQVTGNVIKGVLILATVGAAVTEVIAVPVALFLLVRRGPYVTALNLIITVLAAIPLLLVGFVLLAFLGPNAHFHI